VATLGSLSTKTLKGSGFKMISYSRSKLTASKLTRL